MAKTKEEVKLFYKSKKSFYSSKLEEARKKIRVTSIFRISTFIITIIGIYIASGFNWMYLALAGIIGLAVFIHLVIRHAKLFKQKNWFESLKSINQIELDVLKGNTIAKYDGAKWNNPDHPYVTDLDIFGRKSLFQLVDRSATHQGRDYLAERLRKPIKEIPVLKLRQLAILELSGKPDFRQYFQASGNIQDEDENSLNSLLEWTRQEQTSFNSTFNKLMLIANPLIGIAVVSLIIFNFFNPSAFLLFLIIPFAVLMPKINLLNKEHQQLSKKSDTFEKYAGILRLIEKEDFHANMLVDARNVLISDEHSASRSIGKLAKISASFDYRLNLLVGILLNIFFLWDIRQVIRLEKWKKENSRHISTWFDQLAEIDELSSFGGFAFNHPDSIYPELSENTFKFDAKNAKHPFILSDVSVGNDISFNGWQQFQIITGANMAGKSTYLRTVGINMVLAMTGAPVLAEEFNIKPVDLFTGIKTSDSLQDGESYFFAELKRLEMLIRQLETGDPLFIILDEILRGTNSADKQKGSKALISQLVKLGASGMIATHDLTLGELAATFPENVTNKRFEVEIENNELVFDYKLKEGISQNLNASFLMKKMGITMD